MFSNQKMSRNFICTLKYYNVTLWPRLVKNVNGMYIFTGISGVMFTCVKKTDLILIHSNKLNLTLFKGHHAKLTGQSGVTAPAIKTTWFQTEKQYLVIQLEGKLKPGKSYWLYTEFTGELADDLEGFYRSEYMEDGEKKIIAITQMQATYARKAFPCFDEPGMKAVFHITLIHDLETTALSNSQEITVFVFHAVIPSTAIITRTIFGPTKKMSTYLVAFVVSDFKYISAKDKKGVLVRIWARKKAIEDGQGDYALKITQPILEFFEKYYNTSYPLSKSDQIALPDFNSGAMENWGLVTYRETALLYDPRTSANGNKQRIATVVSHELAHMWFGNLVTLKWWNDLWLNEGFASYVEYLGADYAEPNWNMKDQTILYDLQRAFAVDSLTSSHPLSRKKEEVNTPSEISEMFSTISYSKGAAVLKMLSEFLTEPVFAKGLGNYLKQFAFGSSVHSDLWDHLQKAVDQTPGVKLPYSVHEIMNRWILQMGFPVITIDTRTGNVSQKHFLLEPDAVVDRKSEYNYEWFVPIKWMKKHQVQDQLWLLQKSALHKPMKVSKDEWVLANLHVSGYFRVNYDLGNWERLLSQLESDHQVIPVVNRAQILDDAFNLARASIINITLALRTTKYLLHEREYIPWEAALRNLNYFFQLFDRSEVYGAMQAYLKKQVKPLFEYFGIISSNWTTVASGHTDQFTQIIALSLACSTGVEGCRELTRSWFKKWMQNPHNNTIHPNLRSTVYCDAIAAGGTEEWNFGWQMFQKATVAAEAVKLRSALACTKVPWLLNRYLEYTMNPEKIRKQDATSTIGYIASNIIGQPLAWDFVRANWDYFFKLYGTGSFTFSRLISDVTYRFCTPFELSQLKRFQKDNAETGFGSGTQALQQAIEKTTAKIKWLAENKEPVLQWFLSESP
uniref:Aminopeptidase n=1 Tax=Sinocyclocheilus rhinocerous TaxID=307959 RepID=A0A673LRJ6_9TELE